MLSAASLSSYGIMAGIAINPMVAVGILVISGVQTALQWRKGKKNTFGYNITVDPQSAYILSQSVQDIASKMNRPVPKVHVRKQNSIASAHILRNDLHISADMARDTTITSAQKKFVLAHEMSHLHHENHGHTMAVRQTIKNTPLWASISVAALSITTGNLPIAIAYLGVAGGMIGAGYYMAENFSRRAMRIREYRADRTALRLTGDLPAAASFLMRTAGRKPNFIERICLGSTHPSSVKRIQALRNDFQAVANMKKRERAGQANFVSKYKVAKHYRR